MAGCKKPEIPYPSVIDTLFPQANVMLSYKLPAAIELLRDKLKMAEQNTSSIVRDLEYIKEQITIMEVNTARVYNWDVKRRREKREKEELQKG